MHLLWTAKKKYHCTGQHVFHCAYSKKLENLFSVCSGLGLSVALPNFSFPCIHYLQPSSFDYISSQKKTSKNLNFRTGYCEDESIYGVEVFNSVLFCSVFTIPTRQLWVFTHNTLEVFHTCYSSFSFYICRACEACSRFLWSSEKLRSTQLFFMLASLSFWSNT